MKHIYGILEALVKLNLPFNLTLILIYNTNNRKSLLNKRKIKIEYEIKSI